MKFSPLILIALALTGCKSIGKAPTPKLSTEAAQRQLAEAYLAATRAHDPAQVRKLLHPAVLSCINDSNRDVFDFELTNKAQEVPSSAYKIWITPVSASYPPPTLPADKFSYPVQPTHQFQIDFDLGGPDHTLTMLGAIAQQNGDWFLVLECPNAAGVQLFHDMIAQGQH
jgi:hypothetical protein